MKKIVPAAPFAILMTAAFVFLPASSIHAQDSTGRLVLEREGRTISLVPYAPNILRVTLSTEKSAATADPGYGIVATPSAQGWTHERDTNGDEV